MACNSLWSSYKLQAGDKAEQMHSGSCAMLLTSLIPRLSARERARESLVLYNRVVCSAKFVLLSKLSQAFLGALLTLHTWDLVLMRK